MATFERNHAYVIDWEARDIGYGVESGEGEYVYRGRASFGKLTFEPVGGGDTLYLFEDELLSVAENV